MKKEVIDGVEYIVQNMGDIGRINSSGMRYNIFLKDSAAFIIERFGSKKIFSATIFNTVLAIDTLLPHCCVLDQMMVRDSLPIVVPAGTFTNILVYKGEVRDMNGDPLTYPGLRYTNKSYAKGVGLVLHDYGNVTGNLTRYERRLVEYQVN